MIANLLYYGIPGLVIAVTLWVGFLGWRFYVQEVVRGNDNDSEPAEWRSPSSGQASSVSRRHMRWPNSVVTRCMCTTAVPKSPRIPAQAPPGLIAPGSFLRLGLPDPHRGMLLHSLFGADTSIRVKPRADVDLIRWGSAVPSRMHPVTVTREHTGQARARAVQPANSPTNWRTGRVWQFCHTDGGVLYLYRDASELAAAERNSLLLREHGRHQAVLDAEHIIAVEPALTS